MKEINRHCSCGTRRLFLDDGTHFAFFIDKEKDQIYFSKIFKGKVSGQYFTLNCTVCNGFNHFSSNKASDKPMHPIRREK
jgi:hypothetical protein